MIENNSLHYIIPNNNSLLYYNLTHQVVIQCYDISLYTSPIVPTIICVLNTSSC